MITEASEEGICKSSLKVRDVLINCISVYSSGKVLDQLESIDFLEEGNIIIGSDFNIRTGSLNGGPGMQDDLHGGIRKSKDCMICTEGRNLMDLLDNKGWYLTNGVWKGNEEGEYTYVGGRDCTVINYD